MSKDEKLIERLKTIPVDFTYDEAGTLLLHLGFAEINKGKTSGSRVMFFRVSDGRKIMLHKPHPQNVLKKYAVLELVKNLMENGDIQ